MHNHPPPNKVPSGPTVNRIADVMAHTTRYAFHGVKHLSEDSGLSRPTISRIISGSINPHFEAVAKIAKALERELKRPLDPRDLFATNADFPHRYTCDLCGCPGCYPERATDEFGDIKSTYQSIKPGQWVTSKFPRGLTPEKDAR